MLFSNAFFHFLPPVLWLGNGKTSAWIVLVPIRYVACGDGVVFMEVFMPENSRDVVKTIVSFEVLTYADEAPVLRSKSLSDIAYEVCDGDWIAGSLIFSKPSVVPREELSDELKAIGNDGTFFDDMDLGDQNFSR